MDFFIDCLLDAFIDSIKLVPFLVVIYILIELLTRKAGNRIAMAVKKAGAVGPLIGGAVGVIPQCGLSAAAATLFSDKVITVGTMLAVFLSASDDMLPILISSSFPVLSIGKLLTVKMCIGIFMGYMVDIAIKVFVRKKDANNKKAVRIMGKKQVAKESQPICMQSCCVGPFWLVVIKRTAQVFAYIFALSLLLNIVIELIGEDTLASLFMNIPVLGHMISALIGLIPNCASSVIITELFLDEVITTGNLFAGLLVNAGVGILVLIRSNKNKKETFTVIGVLYVIGVLWGVLIDLVGLTF